MITWYEVKVKFLKIDQGGTERRVNDTYLIDAISYTDAETRAFNLMNELTSGEFKIKNIKQSNISEVFLGDDGEWLYKAKISLVTLDEESGKEKKINQYILVPADDIDQSLKRLTEGLAHMLISYVVAGINLSPINEVFPYVSAENKEETNE